MCGLALLLSVLGLILAFITYDQGHPAVSVAAGFATAFSWCMVALYYQEKYTKAKTAILAIQEEARINDILLETHIDDI